MARTKEPRTVGGRIKMYRERRGLTIDQVSRLSWVSYVTYTRLENEYTENPSARNLVCIARALWRSVEDITKYAYWDEYNTNKEEK